MDLKNAIADIAGFLSRGGLTASDARATERDGGGFGPTKRLLTAVAAAAVALPALAAAPAGAAEIRDVAQYRTFAAVTVSADDNAACREAANGALDRFQGLSGPVEVVCLNAVTGKGLGILERGGDGRFVLSAEIERAHWEPIVPHGHGR